MAEAALRGAASVSKTGIPFALDEGVARRAAIGLVVLATDNTIEHEFRDMLRLDGVAFYESRIANAAAINPTTLAEMERRIAAATPPVLAPPRPAPARPA